MAAEDLEGEVPRVVVDVVDASSEGLRQLGAEKFRREQGGVEADVRRAGHQWIVDEAGVRLRVRDNHHLALSDRVISTTKRRLPWLFVNLVTAILASLVIAQFEDDIAKIVALAVLMPIVASMGGNAGTQALTVAVRALATKDLTSANAGRVVRREALVGLVNGVFFAVVMGVVTVVWFGLPLLGVVIALAMIINLVVAGLAGVLVPIGLERLGVDPALASGAFVTTVTDVVGFLAFLGLASLWLI